MKAGAADIAKCTLVGRTAEYYRKQIREALGFGPSTVADGKVLGEPRYPAAGRDQRVIPRVAIRSSCSSNQTRWQESRSVPVIQAGSTCALARASVKRWW